MNQKLYLAADSGGTKTLWSFIDKNGESIFECQTEGLAAVKSGLCPVKEIVSRAHAALKEYTEPSAIYCSLGGSNTAEVKEALKHVWPGIPVKVERGGGNGNAILYAASQKNACGAVLCGTGSVAVGNRSNGRRYAGGWGPDFGNEGSGGGIGKEALRCFLRSFDGPDEIGGLKGIFADLTEGIDIAEFEGRVALKTRIHSMSRREIAAFAPPLYQLYEEGDALSLPHFITAQRKRLPGWPIGSVITALRKLFCCVGISLETVLFSWRAAKRN